MQPDDVILEVRALRENLFARYNYDLDALVAAMQERQRAGGRVFLTPPDRPAVAHAAAEPSPG